MRALEDDNTRQFAAAMSSTITKEEKSICIAKVNFLLEKREEVAKACNMDRTASAVIDKIKAKSSDIKEQAVAFISRSTTADDFHARVADYLVTLYEAPAAMSNEDIKAHAHRCNGEIRIAFKRKSASNISKLDEELQ